MCEDAETLVYSLVHKLEILILPREKTRRSEKQHKNLDFFFNLLSYDFVWGRMLPGQKTNM